MTKIARSDMMRRAMSSEHYNPEQTNPSLIRRIKVADNQSAWNEFDTLYRPMLRRFAKARGLGEADVEDVVQHCMTAVYVHIEGFTYDPRRGRFKSWLRTLVNNRCRDLLRSKRATPVELKEAEAVESNKDSPEDAFEKIWIEEHLNHCMRKMSDEVDEPTFTAFRRYVLDGHSVEEVCRDLKLTPNQLYKIKHRLTSRLRELMDQLVGEEFALPSGD